MKALVNTYPLQHSHGPCCQAKVGNWPYKEIPFNASMGVIEDGAKPSPLKMWNAGGDTWVLNESHERLLRGDMGLNATALKVILVGLWADLAYERLIVGIGM